MVYGIGKISAGGVSRIDVVGEKDGVWDRVEYLEPDTVDRHAKARTRPLFGYGYPIDPQTAPQKVLRKKGRQMPADYAMGNNHIMLVSPRFRSLVEQFEDGVHQFLPVQVFDSKKASEPYAEYYWFICCTLLDSLNPEKTTLTWSGFYDERMEDGLRRGSWYFDHKVEPQQKAVFDLSAIGENHLWRDAHYSRDFVFCSDKFGEALIESKMSGFGLSQKEQV